jgi:hypothetical protein
MQREPFPPPFGAVAYSDCVFLSAAWAKIGTASPRAMTRLTNASDAAMPAVMTPRAIFIPYRYRMTGAGRTDHGPTGTVLFGTLIRPEG